MKKYFSTKVILIIAFLIILGAIYYNFILLNIIVIKNSNTKENKQIVYHIKSNMQQHIKLQVHMDTDKTKMISFECNNGNIFMPVKSAHWWKSKDVQISILLQKNMNICIMQIENTPKTTLLLPPEIKQKITYLDYFILFLLWGILFYNLLFNIFIFGINKIKYKINTSDLNFDSSIIKVEQQPYGHILLILSIFIVGILIRILYFNKFGISNFQHDVGGHIAFIKYIAESWTLPLPSEGWEYPQQPLYYMITGSIYAILRELNIGDANALYGIGLFSLLCSIVFLYYSYKFTVIVSSNIWVRTISLLIISLMPSLVYMSSRINNDALVMAFAALSIYYISKSYKNEFQKGFYSALIATSLLFMTKVSAASIEILLFLLLLVTYSSTKNNKVMIERKIYLFGLLGLFLLGFTLLKNYLPITNNFNMVHSGIFPKQAIEALNFNYFTSFHLEALLKTGYSYVFGDDTIRQSLLTYQYGTMFFGEFNYAKLLEKSLYAHSIMKIILIAGLIYILGFITYLAKIYKLSIFYKILLAIIFLNFLLVLHFFTTYPSICNTDFRYYVPSFALLSFFIAEGLLYYKKIKFLWYIIITSLFVLGLGEIIFFIILLGSR